MEQNHLALLAKTLDDIKHQNGAESWYARELYPLLGYARWENFETAINRAKESCQKTGAGVEIHFREVTKTSEMPNGGTKEISDIKLTRYACYLVTLNGDPKKEAIAFAQAYFITQTRTVEVLQQRMVELERIDARQKLKITEKEFSDMAFSRGVDGKSTAMTIEKTRQNNLSGKNEICDEHVNNNTNVRGALTKTGICPESLPPGEDIKKIEARHRQREIVPTSFTMSC